MTVDGDVVAVIGKGLVVLLGVAQDDSVELARRLASKVARLRIFENDEGRFDRSLPEVHGDVLVVSQFTLIADIRRGRRPFFGEAEIPERARALCDHFSATVRSTGIVVATGTFGAMMQVELCNDGPVTLVIDSADLESSRRDSHRGPTDDPSHAV